MESFLHRIFKEYEPLTQSFNGESLPIILYTLAFFIIGVGFTYFGILCLSMAGKYTERNSSYPKRKNISYLVGASMLTCGISRLIGIVCLYHNYAMINGLVGCITALVTIIMICYAQYVVTTIKESVNINDLKEKTEQTKQTMEELQETIKKLAKD